MRKYILIQYGLLIAFLTETFCVCYALKFPAWIPAASVIYFIAGLVIAFLFLGVPEARLSLSRVLKTNTKGAGYKILLLLIMAILMHHFTKKWIIHTPLSITDADMLPVMKVMSQRFLQGQWANVYSPIPEIWGGMQPIYLPAMWLPFTIAVACDLDLRWISTTGLFFSFSFFLLLFDPFKKQLLPVLLALSACILFWWLETEAVHNFIRLSEEGIVVFYYSLLILSLFSGNCFLIALAAALCVLSRYSLAGWLPAMLIYFIFIRKNIQQAGVFVITGLLTLVVLVILPFGGKIIQSFIELPYNYVEHANRVWRNNPEFFYGSMGFAKFFGPDRTVLLHRVLISMAFVLPMFFMVGCLFWERRKKIMLTNIPLACLKFSLVIFYNFLDVPYLYLFYTSSFVSLVAITCFLRQNTIDFIRIK